MRPFSFLREFFSLHETDAYRRRVFDSVLPAMARMALRLPSLCTQPIPFLMLQCDSSVSVTQEQAACLMCAAFFCLFPVPEGDAHAALRPSDMYLPSVDFSTLFSQARLASVSAAKLRYFFHYFDRVCGATDARDAGGVITFHRQVLPPDAIPQWRQLSVPLSRVCVLNGVTTDAPQLVQVDFAHKYIGGGILLDGSLQEEILFLTHPELVVARLITFRLDQVPVAGGGRRGAERSD